MITVIMINDRDHWLALVKGYICLDVPHVHHDCGPRTVLHRFEGGALRSLHFLAAGEIHCLLCAAPWWKKMAVFR